MTSEMEVNPIKHKTVKQVFSYSLAVGVTQILMMAYTVVLMRWVTPEQFGIISANYATILLLSFLINWGMNEWLVKEIPTSDNPGKLTGSVIWFKVIIGLAWGLLIWAFLPFIQPGIYQRGILAIILIDVWMDSCFNLLIADRIGNEKVHSASILLVSSRIFRLASLLILIMIRSDALLHILTARLITTCIFFLLAWFIVRPQILRKNGIDFRNLFKQSIAFNSSEMLTLIFAQIDINLLTWIVGDAALIGAFAFVTTLINMFMTIPLGIYSLLLPGSIKTYRSTPDMFFKRMQLVLVSFVVIASMVWMIIALPGTSWMIMFLGEDYILSTYLLLMAAPILFLRVVNQVNNVYLVSVGQENKRILPQAVAVVLKLAVGFLIATKWQALGLIKLGIMADAILVLLYSIQTLKHFKKRGLLQTT